MFVGNPIRAIQAIINGIITAFVSSPRRVLLYSFLWVLIGTSCGLLGLGNKFGFFNLITSFFFIVAGLLFMLALVKYVLWKRNSLRETLPDGTVLVAFGHTEIQLSPTTNTPLSGRHISYVLPIAPTATGSNPVRVPCPDCQQDLTFQVDSLQLRKAGRRGFLLSALITLLVGLGLNVFLSPLYLADSGASWVFWVRLVGYIFLFISGVCASALLQYTGVRIKQLPKGHSMLPTSSSNLADFRDQKAAVLHTVGEQQV